MQYLIRKGKNRAAHIWLGSDTACRMWSTGGIPKRKSFVLEPDSGDLRVCHMCEVAYEKIKRRRNEIHA